MLKKLYVKNFKSIDEEELILAPLTILTGVNSTGKSTVIQSILLLLKFAISSNRFTLERVVSSYTNPRENRNRNTNEKNIKIQLDLDDKYFKNISLVTINGIDGLLHFRGSIECTEEYRKNIIPNDPPHIYSYEPQETSMEKSPELFYLNATRLGPQTTSPKSEIKVGPLAQFIFTTFDKIKNNPLPTELVRFEESKTINYQVSKWLSEISGSVLELKTEQSGSDQVEVKFNSNGLDNILPDNLGAGISYLAKIVILCFMAKKGDLVIIENPEIHLHPKSQSKLGEFFSFISSKGIQLIIETHCEHLINKVAYQVYKDEIDSNDVIIHYKSKVNEKFSTILIDGDGEFKDSEEAIISFPTGFFDATLAELMEMR